MGKKISTIYYVLILLFSIGLVSSLGCCVGSRQDSCSTNSEKTSCEQFGGTFYNNDPSCGSVRVCDSGCCKIGLDSARMTRGKCQTETEVRGFAAIEFLQTADDCNKFITSGEWGACIGLNSYGKKSCKFVTRTQCAGEFFKDVLCTEAANSNCNKTDEKVCVGNSIYLVDSCGNRDSLVKECNYNTGSVCKQTDNNGKYTAECVEANCKDDFDFTSFIVKGLYKTAPVFSPVTRKQGEVWCVTNGNVPFNDGELERNLNAFNNTISGATGLRFFSRSCVNGQILTEPCEDGKEGYCSGKSDWESTESVVGTGGRCVGNDWRGCLAAENEADCDKNSCFWFSPENMTKGSSKMIKDLNLAKCLPKISGGIVDSTSTSTICSQGDFETTFSFTFSNQLAKKSNSVYGNTGLLLGNETSWRTDYKTTILLANSANNLYLPSAMATYVYSGKSPFIILNPEAVAFMEYRCSLISDCTGKMNWVGEEGRNSSGGVDFMTANEIYQEFASRDITFSKAENVTLNNYLKSTGLESYGIGTYPMDEYPILFGSKGTKNKLDMTFKFKCVPRKTSLNGDCKKCSEKGSICSEYVCSSLGTNCEFSTNSGTCESKGDTLPPNITINCPSSSSIGIQKPVKISVSTSETSQCRFNLGSALATFDAMQQDFGTPWGTSHDTILTVYGSNQVMVGNATQYPLLVKSGTYDLYVRCVDPKGNGDTVPAKLCSFNVPETPDKNPPVVLKFNPKADTPILFNSTTQEIAMLVNEPVECKWSLKDQDFDLMNESFDCRKDLVFRNDVSGYECNTELSNITKNLGNSTKFYIRCKDQPDLENETAVYSRNTNIQSTVYSLKPSAKLEIIDLSPKGRVVLGPNFANWNLSVKTEGGGYNGITECKWRLDYRNYSTAFSAFSTTQSTFKTQSINQKTEGDYTLSVTCADDSGNTANYSGPLEVRYDRTPPMITRIYNDKGNFKITTNEPSLCRFTNIISLGFGCAFTIAHPNLTSMTDVTTLEHNTNWKKGSSYFVKCQDFYGNENSLCGTIAKAI